MNKKHPNRVAILVDQDISLFELGCAVELFALPRPEIPNWYQTEVVSFSSQPLNATGGVLVQPKVVHNLFDYDMLIIPSWPIDRSVPQIMATALQRLFQSGGSIISFCSGAFVLGELGLLDGRRAVTHWRYAIEFKRRFPLIEYVDDVLYVYEGKIGCSAGSSAAIDLGIDVIRAHYGYHIANQIARRLVLAAHRNGGQSQFVEAPIPKEATHFSETLDWAIQHIQQSIEINQLADKANMTRRTFDRHFRKTLNMSPKEWLIYQRLERAKTLLESTGQNIEVVAHHSGFETAMAMRHNFRKYLSVSPSTYRKQFSSGNIFNGLRNKSES
jgi:AraC family transcriptional activator FtrA